MKVKRTIMIFLGPYSEILKERKGKSQQSKLHALFKKRKGTLSERSNLCIMLQSKKINPGALQWHSQKFSAWALNISK
jgi:hypothetical protein